MGMIGDIIAASCDVSQGYAQRLLTEVSASDFGKLARPGGQVLQSNHPAFVYGHLSLYPSRIVDQLGQDASAIVPSDQYTQLFSAEAECQDDPDGTIYPSQEEITSRMFDGYRLVSQVLRETDDSLFAAENPREGRLKELFPTLGAMHTFYVGGHFMSHMGQISAWRRAMGLGPA